MPAPLSTTVPLPSSRAICVGSRHMKGTPISCNCAVVYAPSTAVSVSVFHSTSSEPGSMAPSVAVTGSSPEPLRDGCVNESSCFGPAT